MKTNLPKPKTNLQEVLLTLIEDNEVSILNFPYLSGFRTRCSELYHTHQIYLQSVYEKGINKFGNTYSFVLHKLPESEKEKAINVYLELVK